VFSSPAIGSDGTVYVGSWDDKLYAIKTESKGLAKSPWPMRGQNAQHTGRAIAVNPPSLARLERNSTSQGEFTIVAYNVQNLFDLDGVSQYNDFKPDHYGPSQLERKLKSITDTLSRIGDGTGPDIVLLQEIELDRTANKHKSATELLKEALDKNGLGPYHLAKGRIKDLPLEKSPAIVCVTLSKFPIKETRNHWTERARPILETHLDIEGQTLVVFNNHWKSGASSADTEPIRIQNASVLRKRIDELLTKNPTTDIIVGGDLNSHYNQKQVFEGVMPKTAVNDVLLSQGNESLMQSPTDKLYNLWHELQPKDRGSDVWKGEWGTLMHLVLSHGLYDDQGIQYQADSFRVGTLEDFNVLTGSGIPNRWYNDFGGIGTSDHLPVIATFATAQKGKPVEIGANHPESPAVLPKVDYAKAIAQAKPFDANAIVPGNFRQIFSFEGQVVLNKPLTVETNGTRIRLWSFDPKAQAKMFAAQKGDRLEGYGYLSRYRGEWQLVVEERDWLLSK
jgi:endonuclease/exonuclease/phosphatase family metal-dependent hydrolase